MTRTEQYLAILRNQESGALQGSDRADACLREMLVHASFADGIVNEDEFQLLERILPDLSAAEVLIWVADTAQKPLDMARLLNEFSSREQRSQLLALAREMVAIDQEVDPQEHLFLVQLTAACQDA